MEPRASDGTRSLAAAIHCHGRTTPEALAVCAEGRSLTYRQLAGHAARLAARLRAAPGWEPGIDRGVRRERARVGILASRSVDACVAVVGTAWAGATYVPLGLRLPDERLLAILSACNLTAIVADAVGATRLSGRLLEASPRCLLALGHQLPPAVEPGRIEWLDTAAETSSPAADEPGAPVPMAAADVAYIIFTSGTTGIPKGVMISLRGVRHYIDTTTRLLELGPTDRAMESCDLTFDVSVHNMFTTWEAGGSLHVLPATRAMGAVKFARMSRLTVWNSVPALAGRLRQLKALAPAVLPDLRLTVFGGEQLTRRTVQAWQAAAPASAIWNLYGPTEATVYCMAQPVCRQTPMPCGRDVVAIGGALPGSEAAVLGTDRRPVADGQRGELAIAGVQLARGYLDAPEQTASRFPIIDGRRWYLTGDLALRDASGSFHWLGRLDNQVKLLGNRIELEEVDTHLRVVTDADLVATVAWPISDGGALGLVGFVAGGSTDGSAIVAALKERLPAYMIPARIVHLDSMPVNANGKVDRKALLHRLQEEDA